MFLKGKLIVVSGGATGIGRSIAERCAAQGAKVIVASRSAAKARFETAGIEGIDCDVSRQSDVDLCFEKVKSAPEPLFGLVCAAGILGEVGPLESASPEGWKDVWETNVLGTVLMAKASIPLMRKEGGGRMIFFSGGGQGAQPFRLPYVASKGAIWRITESLARELRDQAIFVNAVAPGAVNTRFLDDLLQAGPEKAGLKEYELALKQKESGGTSPAKAAALVEYLFSEKAAGLTGKVLSAVWDPYTEFSDPAAISDSDLYTMRRVVDSRGGTRVR